MSNWLANLFCYGPSLCLHAASSTEFDFLGVMDRIGDDNKHLRYVGNSDPCLLLNVEPPDVLRLNAKLVVITREPGDVICSYRRYFSVYPDAAMSPGWEKQVTRDVVVTLERIAEIKAGCNPDLLFLVDFSELRLDETIHRMWNFLLPGVPFNEARLKILRGFRINDKKA